jgi:hypothetical protein
MTLDVLEEAPRFPGGLTRFCVCPRRSAMLLHVQRLGATFVGGTRHG